MNLVLIIEDEHDTRVALRSALEQEGFEVLSATNGAEGFEILKTITSPVVVVLDQNMPLFSGDDFMRMRASHPRLSKVPVIVASAVANRVLSFGPNAYLAKPFDVGHLVSLIRKFHGMDVKAERAG